MYCQLRQQDCMFLCLSVRNITLQAIDAFSTFHHLEQTKKKTKKEKRECYGQLQWSSSPFAALWASEDYYLLNPSKLEYDWRWPDGQLS